MSSFKKVFVALAVAALLALAGTPAYATTAGGLLGVQRRQRLDRRQQRLGRDH